MERKNPAGMASNPAYFMVFPFSLESDGWLLSGAEVCNAM
jgi:hypothetical protein